jgi:biopolymer transport protein ExbB
MNRATLPLALCAALCWAGWNTALAQEPAPEASAPAPVAAPAAPASEVSLEQAYKREFAFLQAQKNELSSRLVQTRQRFEADRDRLEGEIRTLESGALAAKSEAEALSDELVRMEQRTQSLIENTELLGITFDQARATLGGFGVQALDGDDFAQAEQAVQLNTVFDTALATLGELSRVRSEPGVFYLADGSEVTGTLIRLGNIAAFGISPEASGTLAPAGGERFRLWSAPAEASAQALAAGQLPDPLRVFLFENSNTAVADPEAKTFWGEIAKGGLIGYIIVALGLLALALVVARSIFLKNAGASIQHILEGVAPAMRGHRIDDAIVAAKRFKGSAARVVTAALRGIEKALADNVLERTEREQIEDIVSESILHESGHLNRFGTFILMIAAVAPLLGLLGTVTGMIQTFDVITEFGTSDPKLLSGGIATALVTTQLGLIVAIPVLLLGNLLNGWAERIKDDMEKAALQVVNLYQDVRQPAAAKG